MTRKQLFALTVVLALSKIAAGQDVPPFYSALGTAYTPEIGVANTGILHDLTPGISQDLRYVTLTMGGPDPEVMAASEFAAPNPPTNNTTGGTADAPAPIQVTFLDLHGITRVDTP
jgi:hypothetical protein